MLDGDRFIEELRQQRHEADKLHRLAIWKELMVNTDKVDLCPQCGAERQATIQMLGEDCGHF